MNNLEHTKTTLLWITDILKKHQIPFQISGGLAARAYGATRPIADIDIDIPNDKFEIVKNEVSSFITYGPAHFKSDKWDLLLMTLNYNGQEIDLSGIYQTKIFNEETDSWIELADDLSSAVICDVLGLQLPVIPKHSLISYKKILVRQEDIIDINEMLNHENRIAK